MMPTAPSIHCRHLMLVAGLLAAIATGCGGPAKQPTTKPVDKSSLALTASDPCMERMHNLSGGILLFYLQEGRLPDSLDEMQELPGNEDIEDFVCPLSNKPYVYIPEGMYLPEKQARIILYDPAPAHAGFRLAITMGDLAPGKPPVTKIIAVPESAFLFRK